TPRFSPHVGSPRWCSTTRAGWSSSIPTVVAGCSTTHETSGSDRRSQRFRQVDVRRVVPRSPAAVQRVRQRGCDRAAALARPGGGDVVRGGAARRGGAGPAAAAGPVVHRGDGVLASVEAGVDRPRARGGIHGGAARDAGARDDVGAARAASGGRRWACGAGGQDPGALSTVVAAGGRGD